MTKDGKELMEVIRGLTLSPALREACRELIEKIEAGEGGET